MINHNGAACYLEAQCLIGNKQAVRYTQRSGVAVNGAAVSPAERLPSDHPIRSRLSTDGRVIGPHGADADHLHSLIKDCTPKSIATTASLRACLRTGAARSAVVGEEAVRQPKATQVEDRAPTT